MDAHQQLLLFLIIISALSSTTSGSADKTYFLYTDCRHPDPPKMMDKAWVTVTNMTNVPHLQLYGQVSICEQCSLDHLMNITPGESCTFLLDTKFDVTFSLKNTTSGRFIYSETIRNTTEHGRYSMYVLNVNNTVSFNWASTRVGDDPFIPIYVTLGILVGVSVIWILLLYAYRRGCLHRLLSCCRKEDDIDADLGTPPIINVNEIPVKTENTAVTKSRLRSLDAFRGFSLTIMIFVNYGGGGYWFFSHSYWNGLTVADLVFPWFTWIMGTSIALSFNGQLKKGIKRRTILLKVVRRTAILFALGLLINSSNGPVDLTTFRIPGVLQRLAFTYFCVALVETIFATPDDPYITRRWAPVRDVLAFWPEWLIALTFLLAHLLLTFFVHVHGCPTGYIGPGGLHDHSSHFNCTGGAARAIDKWVFTDNHIYQHPTCKNTYHTTVPYDPEGILGSLTSVFLCFLGLQAGKIFMIHKNWKSRVIRFLIWGLVLGVVAGALCRFSQNDGVIPVNKNLWSASFILTMASTAFFLLAACYMIIDVYHVWSGTPFFYPGMNSIVVYVCHEVFSNYFPITWKVPDTHTCNLALHVWGVSLWVVMSAFMYYKGVFIAI